MENEERKMEMIENGGKKMKRKMWFPISWDGKGEEIILGCWVFHLAKLISSNCGKNWEGHVIEKKITKSLIYFSIISRLIIRKLHFLKKKDIIAILLPNTYGEK